MATSDHRSHPLDLCQQPRHSHSYTLKKDGWDKLSTGNSPQFMLTPEPCLGISEERTGWPAQRQTQDLSTNLTEMMWVIHICRAGDLTVPITGKERACNAHAGYSESESSFLRVGWYPPPVKENIFKVVWKAIWWQRVAQGIKLNQIARNLDNLVSCLQMH